MPHPASALVLIAGLMAGAAAQAVDVKTAYGSFVAPDTVSVVNREEKIDPKTGKPAGMAVFSRNEDPKAVFIVVWNYAEPDPAKPYDPLDGAVKFGNPADKSLTRDAAKPVRVGGVDGGRYEGKLPGGTRAVSYVAVKNGYRLIALLKAPASSSYQDVMDQFGKGFEGFAWSVPDMPGAPVAPAASAP